MEYKVNDIVEMKKNHPCSKDAKQWKLLDVGADVRMECTTCKAIVTMKRYDFDKKLVKVIS